MNSAINKLSPRLAYQAALDSGQLQSDEMQLDVVARLQNLYEQLLESDQKHEVQGSSGGFFSGLFGKPKPVPIKQPVTGLYLWGGVGRGKTLLCDCLLYTSPSPRD